MFFDNDGLLIDSFKSSYSKGFVVEVLIEENEELIGFFASPQVEFLTGFGLIVKVKQPWWHAILN